MADKLRPLSRAETLRRLDRLTKQILRLVGRENTMQASGRIFPRSIDPDLALWFKQAVVAYRSQEFPSLYAALTGRANRRGPKAGKNKKLAVALRTQDLRDRGMTWPAVCKAVQEEHGVKGHDAGNLRRLLREYDHEIIQEWAREAAAEINGGR